MPKGALRYRSVDDMPAGMRARLPSVPKTPTLPVLPSAPKVKRDDPEHREQVDFIQRVDSLALRDPRYARAAKRTFAIPNGGRRSKAEAGRLKAEGVRSGVHDLFCSVARSGFHGLYIEMKALDGRPSENQIEWLTESIDEGYAAFVCKGAQAAFDVWKAYVDGNLREVWR
ncbi:hypothetical protein DyAD56_15970 [Dyella sp. AD56]|uniref:VRR-NUC domain-containing protein n=1 Tax=Dyella sp. AD56 TaxID=1528744 RepID=UPI000CBE28E8|nr:VRR-NUC domain-containing protein [Dyella sp. AD56]PMQ04185.1 hypothetical protein DyAD56_15970 [Dyella sp. AD56]